MDYDHKDSAALVGHIESDMREAMKDRNLIKVDTLKSLLARFSNEEAVNIADSNNTNEGEIAGAQSGVGTTEVSRKVLSLADRKEVIKSEIAEIQQVVAQLTQPSDYKTELEQKAIILQQYLG